MTLTGFTTTTAVPPAWLDTLRRQTEEQCRAHDWAALYASMTDVRRDVEYWPTLWGPMVAIAARELGLPDARAILDEAIAGGFNQIEPMEEELVAAFGADPDWPALAERIRTNSAPVPLVFTGWPTITPAVPLTLYRLGPDREHELRQRIPGPQSGAWATALEQLSWVSRRWRHANSHLEIEDAVVCLDRVDAGDRFACVEYSIVLSQALNALGIPARRVAVRQPEYHVGAGRGHEVSEAWIDDLGRWVVLDGQHGVYWARAGQPLGILELQAGDVSDVVPVPAPGVAEMPAAEVDFWRSYFYSVKTTGVVWSRGDFVPVLQSRYLIVSPRLHRTAADAYPDLSELAMGIEIADGQCAIRLCTEHPFATGFLVDGAPLPLDNPLWTLDTSTGSHSVEVATRTPYGHTAPRRLEYTVAGA